MGAEIIVEKRYDDFFSFYKDISPLSMHGGMSRTHIFRGHSSEKYKLLPSALRQENINKLYQSRMIQKDIIEREFEYIEQEYLLLKDFYIIASKNGLKVPYIEWIQQGIANQPKSYEFYREVLYLYPKKIEKPAWILKEMAYIAALAQHYGVLTRLLDWTFDIHVALYFATYGACKNNIKDDFVTIWALNTMYISDNLEGESNNQLKSVIPPYCDNPNINAQKGILTYWEIPINKDDFFISEKINKIVDRTPLDILCSEHIKLKYGRPILYKLMFPACFAHHVFMQLHELGYNASRLFPGYQGVVRQMEEKKYIYEPWQNILDAQLQEK